MHEITSQLTGLIFNLKDRQSSHKAGSRFMVLYVGAVAERERGQFVHSRGEIHKKNIVLTLSAG
jgi:hypothetical protein